MEPETTVRPAESAAPADWILADARDDWANTVRWGPRGFAVYARVDFAPLGHEDDADPERLLTALLPTLAGHTTTPDDCLAAVWEGWLGSADPVSAAPVVEVPERAMYLFTTTVQGLRSVPDVAWGHDREAGGRAPDLSWPADRAWCVAWDVDEEFAFTIACSEETYAALAAALPGQVRRAAWGDPEPMYADGPDSPAQPIDPRGLGEPIPPGAPGWQRYAAVGLLGGFGLGGMHDG